MEAALLDKPERPGEHAEDGTHERGIATRQFLLLYGLELLRLGSNVRRQACELAGPLSKPYNGHGRRSGG
jgi:hypothetical protein